MFEEIGNGRPWLGTLGHMQIAASSNKVTKRNVCSKQYNRLIFTDALKSPYIVTRALGYILGRKPRQPRASAFLIEALYRQFVNGYRSLSEALE